MSIDARLNKLFPGLTAQERGILVLKSWKEGKDEDPQIRLTMPPEQGEEFNRLIGLMNAANVELGALIALFEQIVVQIEIRHAWLMTIRLWQLDADDLAMQIALYWKKPVTEKNYETLVGKARSGLRLGGGAGSWSTPA